MSHVLRSIAIRRLNILSSGSEVVSEEKVSTPMAKAIFITQLAELGFRVRNPDRFNDGILSSFDEDIKVLTKLRGGDVEYVPLFSGFPNEVPNKDIFLMKRIAGYIYNQAGLFSEDDGVVLDDGMIIPDWLFDLDQFGGDPILGRQSFDLFEAGVEDQKSRDSDSHVEWIDLSLVSGEEMESSLLDWMAQCFYSKSSIKVALKEDIEALIAHFGISSIDMSRVSFKETRTYLVNHLWASEKYEDAASAAENPTDILRLMAYLTESDVSLSAKIKFPKLSRRQRRSVLSVIERSRNAEEDLDRYKGLWLAFGRGLHPSEYASQFPKTASAFDTLRNKKVISFASKVEEAIRQNEVGKVCSLLKTRPAVFGRKLHEILSLGTASGSMVMPKGIDCDSWSNVLDAFDSVAHEIPIKNLMVLQSYFRTIEKLDYRTTINKKGKLRVYKNKKGRITTDCNDRVNEILSSAINRAMSDKPSWNGKTVFIEKDLSNFVVPLSERAATEGLMTLARGTRVKIDTSNVVRLFIHWKDNEQRTDLDLSAICYDDNMNFIGQVSYTNLSSGDIVHSGDITSAPYGAAEFIDIPVDRVKKKMSNVRYISTQVYIFHGDNFSDLNECYAGWMVRKKADKNQKSFDVKTVQTKFDIKGAGKYVIPCLLDLKTNEIIYVDLYVAGSKRFVNSVETSVSDVGIITREVARMRHTRPNMYDLAVENALGRGASIIDSKEDADITFGISESTFNATDVEKILSELV